MAVTYTVPSNTPNLVKGTVTAADDAITLSRMPNASGVSIQLAGTWAGTITFEATVDGTNWVALNLTPSNSGTDASTATANGAFSKAANGWTAVRARFSTATSGTPAITIRALQIRA